MTEETTPPMDGLTDLDETARRVKAARAYAELTREQLALRTGPALTVKALKLIEERSRQSTTREELLEIGRACGVPDEFMEIGFRGAQAMFAELQDAYGAVLSQNMRVIMAEATRLGVAEQMQALVMEGAASNGDGLSPLPGGGAADPSAAADGDGGRPAPRPVGPDAGPPAAA